VNLTLDTTAPLDPLRNTIKLLNPLTGVNLALLTSVSAQNVYFDLGAGLSLTGPAFAAAYPGEDGNQLAVQIRPSDRPIVAVNGATAGDTLQVASTAGFYTGAVVEYASAPNAARAYQTVIKVDGPNLRVQLDAAVAGPAAGAYLRVLEIDVLVYDGATLAETFAGSRGTRTRPRPPRRATTSIASTIPRSARGSSPSRSLRPRRRSPPTASR
jgi:hypothetical protein